MPLSDKQLQTLREEAERNGLPTADVIKAAEKLSGADPVVSSDNSGAPPEPAQEEGGLQAKQFLIGFLPYVTVREFRGAVLGLTERAPDDELFTGEWLVKHGGQTSASDDGLNGRMSDDGSNGRSSGDANLKGREDK